MLRREKLLLQKIFSFIGGIAVLLVLLFAVAFYVGDIKFPDGNLEAVIREKIGNPEAPISRSDLLQITHLDASGRDIVCLDGLEHLSRLSVLDLKDNQIRDLTPLGRSRKLVELNLRNNDITCLEKINFDVLLDLPLRKLSLRHNVVKPEEDAQVRLSDIGMLGRLVSLEELELRDNHIEDVSPLSTLVNMRVLDLGENRISDITPLSGLTRLIELDLSENLIRDISPLASLKELTSLNIQLNNDVTSIKPLGELDALQTLNMRHVPVRGRLYILQNMGALRKLDIRNCGVINIGRAERLVYDKCGLPLWLDSKAGVTVRINEVMSSNTSTIPDEDGDHEDWIELYNYGNDTVNLGGWGLTDRRDLPRKWTFPRGTVIRGGEYLLVWASGKDRRGTYLHTNFSLSRSGEYIMLTTPDGLKVDLVPPIAVLSDHSIGRIEGKGVHWFYFSEPTPRSANVTKAYRERLEPVRFSHTGGFYPEGISLKFSHPDPDAVIVYTLDGSTPDIDNLDGTSYSYKNRYSHGPDEACNGFHQREYRSYIYTGALDIADRSSESDRLTQISTTNHADPDYFPSSPVRKGTVVQARAYKEGAISSGISANTYFVWPQGNPYDLPVVSLHIQENLLFDYHEGIYTAGADYDLDQKGGNYFRRGRLWEYPAHVEIFYPGSSDAVVRQGVGVRIHGVGSRAFEFKNLRLYARGRYDKKSVFKYRFFENEVYSAADPDNDLYKRILLRGCGANGPILNDVVYNRLMQPVFEGVCRIRPAVHFINGEYWGITALRDRFDKYHIGYHYDIDPGNVIFIKNGDLAAGVPSDMDIYNDMLDFITGNDMSDDELFAEAEQMLCMRSYADHHILNFYSSNSHYEHGFWRARKPSNDHYGDGKWRMYIQDFEHTLIRANWLTIRRRRLSLFSALLENGSFRRYFINRFADHINTTFDPERFISVVNEVVGEVADYLPEHGHRFNNSSPRLWAREIFTPRQRDRLIRQARRRPSSQRSRIRKNFDISHDINVDVDVSGIKHGHVRINTIIINDKTLGVRDDPYPWTGVYFSDIPIELEALPLEGYRFVEWVIMNGSMHGPGDVTSGVHFAEPVITLTLSEDTSIKAVFKPVSQL